MGFLDLGWIGFFLLVIPLFLVHATSNMPFVYQNQLQRQCSSTKYTSLCVQTLQEFPHKHGSTLNFVSFLVNKTLQDSYLPIIPPFTSSKLVSLQDSTFTLPLASISDECEELMKMSSKRLGQATKALSRSSRKHYTKNDIKTLLSAAITFQQSCKDSLVTSSSSSSSSSSAISHVTQKMDHLSRLVSNSLALLDTIPNSSFRHRLISAGKGRRLVSHVPRSKPHVVVAKDGSGDYHTVTEALNAITNGKGRFVIYVKRGVYKEKLKIEKDDVTLIGEGKEKTVIVFDDSVAGGTSMPETATITVTGDRFIGKDIGIMNTAGARGQQAIALSIASDQSVLYRCSISGYQDTLYAVALRQFYRECDIYGTIDFIFGNAAAIFQSCNIYLRRPDDVKSYNVILANGRTDPRQNTGFALHNCRIEADLDDEGFKSRYKSYLGRPWKEYSRSVVMESYIDDVIAEEGWAGWLKPGDEVLRTLYFAEYMNYGPRGRVSKRVTWQGFHLIGFDEANYFSVDKFIHGVSWLPQTGISFTSGI